MAGSQQDVDAALRGRRVMVVEDEMLVAMELEGILQQQGCSVIGPAPTIDRALDLLKVERPDAAVLDFNLNGRRATPVAEALNAQGIPFVVVSGYGEAQVQAPKLGAAFRIDKPVDHRLLVRRLVEMIDGSRGGADDG